MQLAEDIIEKPATPRFWNREFWTRHKSDPEASTQNEKSIQIFSSIDRLSTGIIYSFELVSSVAVILLAFGLITSMTNVQTNGQVLSDNNSMRVLWAWTQNTAIDCNLLGAIIRTSVLFDNKEWLKSAFYAILSAILLFTAAIISNIEALQQTLNISLSAAYGHLFISVEQLTWVRSIAIVLLIVAHAVEYIGIFKEKYRARRSKIAAATTTQVQPQIIPLQAQDIDKLLQAIVSMNQQMLQAQAQSQQQTLAAIQMMQAQKTEPVTEPVAAVLSLRKRTRKTTKVEA